MIIPWYDNPQHPDAARNVRAPGGYEWWYFEAHDAAGATQVVATFYDGCPFDPEYLRRYSRYRLRPTRNSPPVARDFPCVSLAAYRDGKVVDRWLERHAPGSFVGSTEAPELTIGSSRLTAEGGRLKLWLCGPNLAGEFTFAPRWRHPAVERTLFRGAGEHCWIVSDSLCDVHGHFSRGGERISFAGVGYHDHQFGTGSLMAVRQWTRGTAYFKDRAHAFQRVTTLGGGERSVALVCDAGGTRETDSRQLQLTGHRRLDEARFRACASDGGTEEGVAFCEMLTAGRSWGARRWGRIWNWPARS